MLRFARLCRARTTAHRASGAVLASASARKALAPVSWHRLAGRRAFSTGASSSGSDDTSALPAPGPTPSGTNDPDRHPDKGGVRFATDTDFSSPALKRYAEFRQKQIDRAMASTLAQIEEAAAAGAAAASGAGAGRTAGWSRSHSGGAGAAGSAGANGRDTLREGQAPWARRMRRSEREGFEQSAGFSEVPPDDMPIQKPSKAARSPYYIAKR